MQPKDRHLGERVARSVPFSQFQYVDVVFPTANADVFIEHSLDTDRPDDIIYEVVKRDRAGDVYHDYTADRRPWKAGYILLRCATAGAQVRLRLSVES
jgi:hypothetical protein